MLGIHIWSMEVGDRLVDLETGHCRCCDVVITSPPSIMEEPLVSPSLNAVQGVEGERVGEGEGGDTAIENKVHVTITVHGQRAH